MRLPITSVLLRVAVMGAAASVPAGAPAQRFVPPAGYGGDAVGPDVAPAAEPDAPILRSLPSTEIAGRFRIDARYDRAALAHVKPVGAYAIDGPPGTWLESAWAPGFLPITLAFGDGRCFLLTADYNGGRLSNALVRRAPCAGRPPADQPAPAPPPDSGLRKIGAAWQFGAWADDRAGTTVVGAPIVGRFEPLFEARIATVAIAAMLSPDAPLGNVTLVGRIGRQLVVVVLEVSY